MLTFKNKIVPDPDVVAVLVTCTTFSRLEDGRSHARLDERLEAPLAERAERVLTDLGGHWDRHANCMVLPEGIDPQRLVEQLLEDGSITVTASVELTI